MSCFIYSTMILRIQSLLITAIVSFLLLICITKSQEINDTKDSYGEDLYIQPLQDGKLLMRFQFKTLYRKGINQLKWENQFDIFPLSLADIVANTDIHELHYSLARGNWNYENWGILSQNSPAGANIRARFSEFKQGIDEAWDRLINLISGQFCVSLMSADHTMLSRPSIAFGKPPLSHNSSEYSFYSNLPGENLCTENLTPWKKLLPCQSNSGLASLLNAVNLLKSSYISMSIDIEPVISSNIDKVALTQTITIVFNPVAMFEGKQTWSLTKIFGKPLSRICPAASHTMVYVDISRLDDINKLFPKQLSNDSLIGGIKYASFDVLDILKFNSSTLNIGIKQNQVFKQPPLGIKNKPFVQFETHISGFGLKDGTIVATVTNNHDQPLDLNYMHSLPSFLRVYLHSLKVLTSQNEPIRLRKYNYRLSKNSAPTLIELSFTAPAHSVIKIYYEFDRVFLRWTEYKPDANRGVLIGPALLEVPGDQLNLLQIPYEVHSTSNDMIEIYSKPLLIILPTPDFSMPYNVLCLVCTVLVFAFGPLHTMTTKKIVVKEESKNKHKGDEKST